MPEWLGGFKKFLHDVHAEIIDAIEGTGDLVQETEAKLRAAVEEFNRGFAA